MRIDLLVLLLFVTAIATIHAVPTPDAESLALENLGCADSSTTSRSPFCEGK
jgi:hypothetical protein